MIWDEDGDPLVWVDETNFEQCPGNCDDDCLKCCSSEPILWCDDCQAYAADTAIVEGMGT